MASSVAASMGFVDDGVVQLPGGEEKLGDLGVLEAGDRRKIRHLGNT
jgi:hypothetical protein